MEKYLDIIRYYDYTIYEALYQRGVESAAWLKFYYFFAQYGIVFFLVSFTYLIWMRRINAFLCSFTAMALGGFIDLLIFMFWRRPRPFITHETIINPVVRELAEGRISSFPSSHTYIVFAIATSVFLYGHKKLGAFLLVLAIFVALGRVGTGLHYPSDTIAGAILGILSGVAAYRFVHTYEKYWKYEA
ncbi:MAG: phosphatase PAP2 family protein [Patescibacteria group bacterium]|jgi:undecaprenyl-diphosphatase